MPNEEAEADDRLLETCWPKVDPCPTYAARRKSGLVDVVFLLKGREALVAEEY